MEVGTQAGRVVRFSRRPYPAWPRDYLLSAASNPPAWAIAVSAVHLERQWSCQASVFSQTVSLP